MEFEEVLHQLEKIAKDNKFILGISEVTKYGNLLLTKESVETIRDIEHWILCSAVHEVWCDKISTAPKSCNCGLDSIVEKIKTILQKI